MIYKAVVIHTTKTRHLVEVDTDSLAQAHDKAVEAAKEDKVGLTIWDEYKVTDCHKEAHGTR